MNRWGVRVAGCRVVLDSASDGAPRIIDDHVGAVAAPGTARRWLLAADVVCLPRNSELTSGEVLTDLPGCLVVADLGEHPSVRVRGRASVLTVPTPGLAWVMGSVAHAWLTEPGEFDTLIELARSVDLRTPRWSAGTPTAAASLRLGGRRSRIEWTARA